MRAYFIRITKQGDPNTVLANFTSFAPDGSSNGSALQVEWDIPVYTYGEPAGGARVKIYGVSFDQIRQATDLNDADITVYGGMAKGLPLANPRQAGILLSGRIFQAFGNWIGREVSLELIAYAKADTNDAPVNLSFTWTKGQTLQAAVTQALTIAFPGSVITGSWSSDLVYTEDQPFAYKTVEQLAQRVYEISRAIIPADSYRGASITPTPAGFHLFDGTATQTAKQISFLDLVGQPTWLDAGTMQLSLVMRADLNVGDLIALPKGANVVNNAASALTRAKFATAFQGTYQIKSIRHLGSSRQAQAQSWVTIVECYAQASSSA